MAAAAADGNDHDVPRASSTCKFHGFPAKFCVPAIIFDIDI